MLKAIIFLLEYLKNKTICLTTYSHVFDGYGFKMQSCEIRVQLKYICWTLVFHEQQQSRQKEYLLINIISGGTNIILKVLNHRVWSTHVGAFY